MSSRQEVYNSLTFAQREALRCEEIKEIMRVRQNQLATGMTAGLAGAGYRLDDATFQRALANACATVTIAERLRKVGRIHNAFPKNKWESVAASIAVVIIVLVFILKQVIRASFSEKLTLYFNSFNPPIYTP